MNPWRFRENAEVYLGLLDRFIEDDGSSSSGIEAQERSESPATYICEDLEEKLIGKLIELVVPVLSISTCRRQLGRLLYACLSFRLPHLLACANSYSFCGRDPPRAFGLQRPELLLGTWRHGCAVRKSTLGKEMSLEKRILF
jgi:hypothetical protein